MSAANELKTLMLAKPGWTLAAAESMTAGHVQARIAAVSGASNFFRGGVTTYDLERKVRLLDVDRAKAAAVNCVSAEVARAMARGACALFDADVGVATCGYAEPSAEQSVREPFAWWAVAQRRRGRHRVRHGRVECPGASRVQAQAMVAEAALAELVAFLREIRSGGGT